MQGEAGRVWFGAPVGAPWLWPSYRAIGSQEGSRLSDRENVLGLFWVTGPQESTKPRVSVKPSYSLRVPVCSRPCAPAQAGQGLTTAKLVQAVASWVSVASSSWSCIFFSSFLGAEERGPVAAGPGHCPPPLPEFLAHKAWHPPTPTAAHA